ncbi:MAG: DUF1573 domain-containing protein [Planctomycetota bacterium]
MEKSELFVKCALVSVVFLLSIAGCQQSAALSPQENKPASPPEQTIPETNPPALSPEAPIADSRPPAEAITKPKPTVVPPKPADDDRQTGPKITLEKTVHDFGELGVGEKGECEFKFKNSGGGLLTIGKPVSGCGCTVPTLSKKKYMAGEEGTIKVVYKGQGTPGTMKKTIKVPTNDSSKANVRLTIQAKVVRQVEVTPAKLELSLQQENAGVTQIVLKSRHGGAFCIKGFACDNSAFQAQFDPNDAAGQFTLEPKVNMAKLRKFRRGTMRISLDHPKCKMVAVAYEVPPQFQAKPSRIWLSSVKAGKSQTREIVVTSIRKKPLPSEIGSVSSKKDYVKLVSQEANGESVKLKVQITPPAKAGRKSLFNDSLVIHVTEDESITIPCYGSYARPVSKKKPSGRRNR